MEPVKITLLGGVFDNLPGYEDWVKRTLDYLTQFNVDAVNRQNPTRILSIEISHPGETKSLMMDLEQPATDPKPEFDALIKECAAIENPIQEINRLMQQAETETEDSATEPKYNVRAFLESIRYYKCWSNEEFEALVEDMQKFAEIRLQVDRGARTNITLTRFGMYIAYVLANSTKYQDRQIILTALRHWVDKTSARMKMYGRRFVALDEADDAAANEKADSSESSPQLDATENNLEKCIGSTDEPVDNSIWRQKNDESNPEHLTVADIETGEKYVNAANMLISYLTNDESCPYELPSEDEVPPCYTCTLLMNHFHLICPSKGRFRLVADDFRDFCHRYNYLPDRIYAVKAWVNFLQKAERPQNVLVMKDVNNWIEKHKLPDPTDDK